MHKRNEKLKGCTDPKAINYNPSADLYDTSCIYSKPVNNYTQEPKEPVTEIDDTLGTKAKQKCELNYTASVDSVIVSNFQYLSDTVLEVEWNIRQGEQTEFITSQYKMSSAGKVSLYQSMFCQKSSLKSRGKEQVKSITINAVLDLRVSSSVKGNKSFVSKDRMSIYPIPVANDMNIEIYSFKKKSAYIKIFTLRGKIIKTQACVLHKGRNHLRMNMESLGEGIYFVIYMDDSGKKIIKKIVKQ